MYHRIAAQNYRCSGSDYRNVFGLRFARLAVLAYFVANLLAILQRLAEGDRGDVHEDILTTVIRSDEAKALILREKFHCSGRDICLVGDGRAEPSRSADQRQAGS